MIFKLRNFSLLKGAVAFSFLLQLAFLFMPNISHAQIMVPRVDGLGDADLVTMIVNIIQLFLAFLGFIALIIILYAGFIWMTSGGNDEKISKAKGIMKSGLIGMFIILASYTIASFILNTLLGTTSHNSSGANNNSYTDMTGGGFGEGALGGGVIESHYPERDQQNVSRNTMIMITLKVPVATSTILDTQDLGNDIIQLCNHYTADNSNGNECGKLKNISILNGNETVSVNNAVGVLQADGKSILIDPIILLGSAEQNTGIIVHLESGIKTNEGKNMFGGLENGYSWGFEVSTFSDTTPPRVTSVRPKANTTVDRNIIIAVNFSEPINILSFPGNIIVSTGSTNLSGELKISNKYKTIEFFSSGDCGGPTVNSCGEQVYCLPGSSQIQVRVKSGDLVSLTSGINDTSGNFLDGDANGTSGGSAGDDYVWTFNTTNNINLTPPMITSIEPENDSSVVPVNSDASATFDKELSASSINSDNFYIYKFDGSSCGEGIKETINSSCFPNYATSLESANTAKIHTYSPYLENNITYRPRITSKLKDGYGNCFNPAKGPGRSNSTDSPQQ